MSRDQNRWLQLAHVALCPALAEVACTDGTQMEALFIGLPVSGLTRWKKLATASLAPVLNRKLTDRINANLFPKDHMALRLGSCFIANLEGGATRQARGSSS